MIEITVYKSSGHYRGFVSKGHAGYAESGFDIICAAVSALEVNALNSLERFTDDDMDASVSEDGWIELSFDREISERAELLMDSMILGLQEIQKSYGNEYIEVTFKEV